MHLRITVLLAVLFHEGLYKSMGGTSTLYMENICNEWKNCFWSTQRGLTLVKLSLIFINLTVETGIWLTGDYACINNREYVRKTVVPTLGLKLTGSRCEGGGARGRCRWVMSVMGDPKKCARETGKVVWACIITHTTQFFQEHCVPFKIGWVEAVYNAFSQYFCGGHIYKCQCLFCGWMTNAEEALLFKQARLE